MLTYRANLFYFLVFESVFLLSHFLGVGLGTKLAGGSINGWNETQLFALTAINGLAHQFFICFFISPIFNMPEYIWNGRLDYVLQKPLPPFFSLIATSEVIVSNIPNLIVNVGLVIFFLNKAAPSLGAATVLGFILLFIAGIAVRLSLGLFCMVPAFFSERLLEGETGFWSLSSIARYPMNIYPKMIERILLYVVPLGMMAAVPSSLLFEKMPTNVAVGTFIASVVFTYLAFRFFHFGVRHYKSVNSGL